MVFGLDALLGFVIVAGSVRTLEVALQLAIPRITIVFSHMLLFSIIWVMVYIYFLLVRISY